MQERLASVPPFPSANAFDSPLPGLMTSFGLARPLPLGLLHDPLGFGRMSSKDMNPLHPRVLVISAQWTSGHSVHRNFFPYVQALQRRFSGNVGLFFIASETYGPDQIDREGFAFVKVRMRIVWPYGRARGMPHCSHKDQLSLLFIFPCRSSMLHMLLASRSRSRHSGPWWRTSFGLILSFIQAAECMHWTWLLRICASRPFRYILIYRCCSGEDVNGQFFFKTDFLSYLRLFAHADCCIWPFIIHTWFYGGLLDWWHGR
jgi:hypothetical protein